MKISIITASYNYENYIAQAIESVLAQTYGDWELIIVDDGSSDNSVEIIKSYCAKDLRIKLLHHTNCENKGLKETLKLGIEHASGDWVAFLESDDLFLPNTLEKRIAEVIKHPEISLVFNDVELFGDENRVKVMENNVNLTRKKLLKKSYPKCIFKDINAHNLILTFSSVMIERSKLEDLNFDTPIDALLDWWLYIHITFDSQAFYIPEKLTKWRMHKGSYISKPRKKAHIFANIEAYMDVYKKERLSVLFLLFILYSLILMGFIRCKYYRVVLIRKIKTLLGIKKKDSPLFED